MLLSAVSFADVLYQARAAKRNNSVQCILRFFIVGKKGLRRHQASQLGKIIGQPHRISHLLF